MYTALDIDNLENFFAGVDLDAFNKSKLNEQQTVSSAKHFVSSHISCCRNAIGKEYGSLYYERLLAMKQLVENKKASTGIEAVSDQSLTTILNH